MKAISCSQHFLHYDYKETKVRLLRASNSKSNSPIRPKVELDRHLISVLVTCKFDEDQIKHEGAKFSQLLVYVKKSSLKGK